MRAPVYCVCLMTKVADGCKFRIRGWTGVACEGPRVSQSCKAGMLQDKCRDLGCFGGERAKFTVAVHAQLLAGRAFFSHPFGLPSVRKALWVTTLPHNTTNVFGLFLPSNS